MPKPRCENCGAKMMPGVVDTPLPASGERTLERCQECGRYETNAEAAVHWTTRFGGRLRYNQRAIVWTPEREASFAAHDGGGVVDAMVKKVISMVDARIEAAREEEVA